MSTLYRVYRPQHFDETIGQNHIKTALLTAISKKKVGHAYIFSGPRGSGKTTFARLFAKSVNCLNQKKDGNPCNKCEICLEITGGSAVDVIEIDAASNRGVDEIRELRERVIFTPVRAKRKIYIIDEVHMLTREAFNALLKTLEEPPAHVIFVLATTELHKVPETIISRCQRFHFHRASDQELRELLEKTAKAESIPIDTGAIEVLIAQSEGSFRDGLSLLGSLSGVKEKIGAKELHKLFGLPPQQIIDELVLSLESGEVESLQKQLVSSLREGLDLVVLAKVMADVFKKRILSGEQSATLAKNALILEQLLVALSRSRYSSDPAGSIISRLVGLSARLSNQRVIKQVTVSAAPEAKKIEIKRELASDIKESGDKKTVKEKVKKVDPVATPTPVKSIKGADEFWGALLVEIKNHNRALYMLLHSAVLLEMTDAKILLGVRFRFYSERLLEVKNRKLIEGSLEKILGRKIKLECEVRSDLDTRGNNDEDLVSAVVDVFELEEVD